MNILVTGSQGFIGSYVCEELLDAGYNVVGLDDYSKYGFVKRNHDDHPNFKLMYRDITGVKLHNWLSWCLEHRVSNEIHYIIHLAAKIGGIKYFHKYPYKLLSENGAIDKAICDLAIWLKPIKLVYCSSSMVFEAGKAPHTECDLNKIPPPFSTYGFSKLAGEYYCKGLYEQHQIPYTIVRPFNCVGIGEDTALNEDPADLDEFGISLSHVIPDFIYKALKKLDPFPIYGDGGQIRCFTHGKDIARGIHLAMKIPSPIDSYNIVRNEPITMKELAQKIWVKINPDLPFNPEFIDGFRNDVQARVAEGTRAAELLGFQAQISLDKSLDEVIEYMKGKLA